MDDFEKQSMFYKAINKLILAAQQIEDFKEKIKLPTISKLKLTLDRGKRQSLFSDPWGWLVSQFSDSDEVLKKVKNELKTIEHSYLNSSARNIETLKKLTKDKAAMQKILEDMLLTKQKLEDLHESTTKG